MTSTSPTLLDRLLQTLDAGMSVEFARQLLALGFSADEQARSEQLSEKAQLGTLTSAERGELEEMLAANDLLTILQAKARVSLRATATINT